MFIGAQNVLHKMAKKSETHPSFQTYFSFQSHGFRDNWPFNCSNFITYVPTAHNMPPILYSAHPIFFQVFCVSQNWRLFCCKIWSVWLLCLKSGVFTARHELNIYNHDAGNVIVLYPLSGWLYNTVWPNEIGRNGDAASQVATLTTCRPWATQHVVWDCFHLSACFCHMQSCNGCTTTPRTPHSEYSRARLLSCFIFLIAGRIRATVWFLDVVICQ